MQSGRRPSTAADPVVPRFPLQLRRGPLLMFAATRRAAWASCALRACVRFIVARVCVVASTLSVRSRRATKRGYAFREAVGTYKEALEQLRLRLHRQRRVAAAVASAAAKQPWAAITPASEDAPVGAKPARTHPSCSATGTTRFPTFLAVARAQACRYSSPWTTPTTQADS